MYSGREEKPCGQSKGEVGEVKKNALSILEKSTRAIHVHLRVITVACTFGPHLVCIPTLGTRACCNGTIRLDRGVRGQTQARNNLAHQPQTVRHGAKKAPPFPAVSAPPRPTNRIRPRRPDRAESLELTTVQPDAPLPPPSSRTSTSSA